MAFIAKYVGECPDCDNPIRVGEYVEFNFHDELVHADCVASHPNRAYEVCDQCFLTKPCGCDDL
jgi:hypothetical protein